MLALVQFTIILDFMIMSPLGAIIMPALDITAAQFGVAVSAYAFSAGISGILAAGFADRFDRKRLLLFFYVGFTLGTALCALAPNYHLLLLGRIVTGLFGGVIGSVVLAIVTDLFALQLRGRVMGFVQTAFAASQVLGIPAGLFLSNHWNWHVAFGALVGLSIAGDGRRAVVDEAGERPSAAEAGQKRLPASDRDRRTAALYAGIRGDDAAGDRRLHADAVRQRLHRAQSRHRYRASADDLSGLRPVQHFHRPLVGRASDAFGKFPTFAFGSAMSVVMVLIYTHLGQVSLTTAILVNVLMFVGIFSRMIPSQALISAIPEPSQRGSFSAVSASLQQLSGGLGSVLAAAIIAQNADGSLRHFDRLGYIVVTTAMISLIVMYFVQKPIAERTRRADRLNRRSEPLARRPSRRARQNPERNLAVWAKEWCPGKDSNLHGR